MKIRTRATLEQKMMDIKMNDSLQSHTQKKHDPWLWTFPLIVFFLRLLIFENFKVVTANRWFFSLNYYYLDLIHKSSSRPADILWKKCYEKLHHMCFPVNFRKLLGTRFLQKISVGNLLKKYLLKEVNHCLKK